MACAICGAEYEDLTHFILKCERLEGERDRILIHEMRGADDKGTLGNLLFRGGRVGQVGGMLLDMWKKRKYWINRLDTLGGAGVSLPLRASDTVEIR